MRGRQEREERELDSVNIARISMLIMVTAWNINDLLFDKMVLSLFVLCIKEISGMDFSYGYKSDPILLWLKTKSVIFQMQAAKKSKKLEL